MDILGIDDDTLDAMDKFKRAAVAIFDGLRRLAPAAIEDRVGGCNSRRRRRLGIAHDAHKHVECRTGMASRE